jgi:hypothetical protein
MKKTICVIILLAATCSLFAQPHSENYILTKWAISSGGGSMSSANYNAVAIVGQSSPPGVSSSANYTLYSGFLGPIIGAPGSALVWIWTDSVDVHMDWDDVPDVNSYYIYRSLVPDFEPNPGNLVGSSTSSDYIDVGAVSDPNTKYFYRITCGN